MAWHNMLLTSNAFLNSTVTLKFNFQYLILIHNPKSPLFHTPFLVPCLVSLSRFWYFCHPWTKYIPQILFFLIFLPSLSCPGKYIFIFPTIYEKRSTFVRYSIFFTNIFFSFFLSSFFLYKTEYFTSSFIVDKQIQKDSLWSTLEHSFPTLSIWTEHSCKASKSPRRIFSSNICLFCQAHLSFYCKMSNFIYFITEG